MHWRLPVQGGTRPDSVDESCATIEPGSRSGLDPESGPGRGGCVRSPQTPWPAAKMRRGDWTAALFCDSILLEALDELNALLGASAHTTATGSSRS